jgi:LysM repeat protein
MKRQIIFSLLTAAVIPLMLCGCEELSGGRSSQYQRQQYDAAASRAQTDQLSATVVNLQNTNGEIIRVVNDLNQKIAALEQKNANLERNIVSLQQQIAAEKQERQTTINKMIEQISKEVSRASVSAPSSGGGPVGAGEFLEHKVESGHTLGAIAKAYNVSVQDIMTANRMKDTNLRVGQTLYIPKKK